MKIFVILDEAQIIKDRIGLIGAVDKYSRKKNKDADSQMAS